MNLGNLDDLLIVERRVHGWQVLHAQSMDGENLRPDAAEVLEKMSTQAT